MAAEENNPYIGPQAFTRQQSDLFFGRELEERDLLSMVLSQRLTLFYAQSGAGKSSLINTRLIPSLEGKEFFVLPVARLGLAPTEQPPRSEIKNIYIYNLISHLNSQSGGKVAEIRPNMTLDEYLHAYNFEDLQLLQAQAGKFDLLPQVLIIDQFEEILTKYPVAWREREDFFVQLGAAMDADEKLWVVLALREEFLAAFEPYAYLVPGNMRARFSMQRLGEAAALKAIQNPAEKFKRPFTPAAAQELVKRLRRLKPEDPKDRQDSQFVEPLHLQLVCRDLWEAIQKEPGNKITLTHLEKTGNVDTALARFYNQVVNQTVQATGISELSLRVWIETRLIVESRIRNFVYRDRDHNETGDMINEVVDKLAELKLLNTGTRDIRTLFELSHDRLVPAIVMENQKWLTTQSDLISAIWHWEISGRKPNSFRDVISLENLLAPESREGQTSPVAEFLQAARHWLEEQEHREQQRMRDLSSVGWGVIFPENIDPAVRIALQPLLEHRQSQATRRNPDFYREFILKTGRLAHEFLADNGTGEGLHEPEKMPHYLLLVGDPDEIPFTFQYQLDVNYAVGRLHFDHPGDYASYAQSVLTAEENDLRLPRQASLFGIGIRDDRISTMSTEELVIPLSERIQQERPDWEINLYTGENTVKENLRQLLGGSKTPAYLFTASHSVVFRGEHPRQPAEQGAIVCYDYPGARQWTVGPDGLPPQFYFSAQDIPDEAYLFGLIAFLWTGYSAGTPYLDNFYRQKFAEKPEQISQKAFIAQLAKRLLSHPRGGALAVIGHVDNLWGTSFMGITGKSRPQTFTNMLLRLLEGFPVGAAMEYFNQRYQELATIWANVLMLRTESGTSSPSDRDYKFANIETAMVDARNYIILGDPAVRLMVAEEGQEPGGRSQLEPLRSTQNLLFHPAPVSTIAWSPDGAGLLTICALEITLWSAKGKLIWSLAAPELLLASEGADNPPGYVWGAWSPDGERIAVLDSKGMTVILATADGAVQQTFGSGLDEGGKLAWSPDGKFLAITSDLLRRGHYIARICDVEAGSIIQLLRGHTEPIHSITFHPTGSQILTAGQDQTARLWEPGSGAELEIISNPDHGVDQALYDPSGTNLIYTSQDRRFANIWNLSKKRVVQQVAGQEGSFRATCFSPKGAQLASGGEDGMIRVWDIETGAELFHIQAHRAPINGLSYNSASTHLASAGADQTVRIWDGMYMLTGTVTSILESAGEQNQEVEF